MFWQVLLALLWMASAVVLFFAALSHFLDQEWFFGGLLVVLFCVDVAGLISFGQAHS